MESHAITVTTPVKLHVVVIYRPLGQLGTFLEELDGLLSSFPEDGSPIIVFGDFNIHSDKPYAANFHSLLASFDLKRLTNTSAHKSGSQLDLSYTRNCVADNVLVKLLHTSDHYFITFNLHLATSEPQTPLPVTFRWNLCSLSHSHLTSVVSSSLPSPTHFSALDVNAATDTLCSTLTSCLDHICPLSSRPARAAPSNSWFFVNIGPNSGSREKIAQTKRSVRPEYLSVFAFIFLWKSTLSMLHTSTTRSTAHLTHAISSKHSTLSSTTSLTADDFFTFFTNKTSSISSQFSAPHMQELKPTTSTDKTPVFDFCSLTEAEVSKLHLSSHPTTCPLDPIPSLLLQAISPSLLPALTHYQHISPHLPQCIQAGSGIFFNLKKKNLNLFSLTSHLSG